VGPAVVVLIALQVATSTADTAVVKGVRSLKARATDFREHGPLVLLTLAELNTAEDDVLFRDLLCQALADPPATTRDAAIQARTLQLLDPIAHRDRIAHCAQFLIDNQAADGRWGPGTPVDPPDLPPPPPPPAAAPKTGVRDFNVPPKPRLQKITLARRHSGPEEGDPVHSRWAAWGLLACKHAGISAPGELSLKAAAAWRRENGDAAEVVSCLATHLYLAGKDWKRDADVLKALDRLADPARPTDPASLHKLKVAMFNMGSDKLGGREWWPEGVKILVAAQASDGGWGGIEETCAALQYLYLRRYRPPDCKERPNGWR
jgi:hypothetical protein